MVKQSSSHQNNKYLESIISNYSKTIVYKNNSDDCFVLIDKKNANGKKLLHEIVTKFKTDIQSLYKFCFNSQSYFFDDTKNVRYVLVVFSLKSFSIVYMMNIKSSVLPTAFILDTVCKKKDYGKRMFKKALQFIFSSKKDLSPSTATFYRALDLQNPFVCVAFSAYIKAGFSPFQIDKIHGKDHILMMYDKESTHIRKK